MRGATFHVACEHPRASDDGPGTAEQPWKTLTRATQKRAAGDVVIIHGGVYRERVFMTASGTAQAPIRFEARTGDHVVVTGADRLTGWVRTEAQRPIYQTAWRYRFTGPTGSLSLPEGDYHRLIGRGEQVIINGYLLRQVLQRDQLAPGAFYVDQTNQRLIAWDAADRDLNRLFVEASVRVEILRIDGAYVHVRGLRFRYAANMAQRGAVVVAGANAVLEDCVIERANSSGVSFRGVDTTVRRCVFRENGQLGFGAFRAHRLRVTECLVEENNTKGFDRDWEAGGNKVVLSSNVVFEQNRVLRNRGVGIWFDIGNTNATVRQCFVAENEGAGIFYEISYALSAQDNVIVGNAFEVSAGGWSGQAGLTLANSPGAVIERNLIFGNREGLNFREQARTTITIETDVARSVGTRDELIRNNLLMCNRDGQLSGWFWVNDNRAWPAVAGTRQVPNLEQLQVRCERNVYWAAPDQVWFHWGTKGARFKQYSGLAEFQAELGLDRGGAAFDPGFADPLRLDFRLSAEMMARVASMYPQGPVPGVTLGVRP